MLKDVMESVELVVNSINETKRASENMSMIMNIQRRLNAKSIELLHPGRMFVKEGTVHDLTKPSDPAIVQLFLFNDLLIRAEEKKKKFGTVRRNDSKLTMTDHAMLYTLKVVSLPESG